MSHFNVVRTLLGSLVIATCLGVLSSAAQAALIDPTIGLTNPSFESPVLTDPMGTGKDSVNYSNTLPTGWNGGWSDTGSSESLRHYRPGYYGLKSNGGYFYDPTDGDQGAAIIIRDTGITLGWIYQSLGTVAAEDIGKLLEARIDTSTREVSGNLLVNGERRISFRSAVTSGRNGIFGVLESDNLVTAARIASSDDPFHTITERFTPDAVDLGKEIFVVFSVSDSIPVGCSDQYQFDNVQLFFIPEPTTLGLLALGVVCFLPMLRRRRRQ